jgi:hypothetical protein
MANPLKGEASVEAGGETFTLVCDINALVLAEDASELDVSTLIERLERGTNLKALRAAFWACLQARHECHLIRAGEIIAQVGLPAARAALNKAIAGAFPPAEKGTGANPPQAADATGSNG